MTIPTPPEAEIVARTSTENGCQVTSIIYDPADAQQILYGVVARDGVLVGSYYCAEPRPPGLADRHRRRPRTYRRRCAHPTRGAPSSC